ncbi:hypothetical protein [Amycolatopsis minnesotensis]|uniref:Uncharacterized protein n=1 Tax=Amycolatopsis minnesotensis TaxID=337894 RepID=A0ABN2SZ18_9PSEU
MDFDTVADELYALPRAEFVAARDRRQAEARKAGDRELAARIKKLPKPTVAADVVNRLVREHREDVEALAALGEELRETHRTGTGRPLPELTKERHRRVRELAGGIRDESFSDSAAIAVEETLNAVVADAESAAAVLSGRLDRERSTSADSATTWLLSGPEPGTRPSLRVIRSPEPPPASKGTGRPGRARQRDVAKAKKAVEEAEGRVSEAVRALEKGQRVVERAQNRVVKLRAQLREAEDAVVEAKESVTELGREQRSALAEQAGARERLQALEGG